MFAFYIAQHASRLLMNAIFGSTSLLYGSWLKLSNRSDRTDRQPSCEHEVVNEMQFSDLTGSLYLSIRTGCIVAFSDRVS